WSPVNCRSKAKSFTWSFSIVSISLLGCGTWPCREIGRRPIRCLIRGEILNKSSPSHPDTLLTPLSLKESLLRNSGLINSEYRTYTKLDFRRLRPSSVNTERHPL